MFDFFKKKLPHTRENASLLALDIGTDTVKAIICLREEKKGMVIGVGKKKQKPGDMQSGSVTDIASVIRNCQDAISEAEKTAGERASGLIMGIAGELVKGAIFTSSYPRQDPDKKIDFDELNTIIHKLQWKAFDHVRSELSHETGWNEVDLKLIHAAITDVRVDGYKVMNPIGFQGKEVRMSFFNAFSPLIHYGVLQTIAAELSTDLLAITAEPYALAHCLSSDERRGKSSIFIDIGGGTTDIAVVQDGILQGTKMFAIGGRTFTKRLSQALNVSFDEAEEIKMAYASQELEKQSQKIVQECLRSDCDVWMQGVILTLGEFSEAELPPRIYLCGGGAFLPELSIALQEREWIQSLPFPRKPSVTLLEPKHLLALSDTTGTLSTPQDVTPLALADLALDLFSEEKILGNVLRKVVRLMQV